MKASRSSMRSTHGVLSALTAGAAVAVLATGCSAGQVTQTSMQHAAVNGNATNVGDLALRDVYLESTDQRGDFVRPPQQVTLRMAVTNQSADRPDEIVAISSDFGTVTYTGQRDIPPIGLLVIGEPEAIEVGAGDQPERRAGVAEVSLTREITNGLVYPFTFTFARAGSVKLNVPVAAGPEAPRRGASPGDAGEPEVPVDGTGAP